MSLAHQHQRHTNRIRPSSKFGENTLAILMLEKPSRVRTSEPILGASLLRGFQGTDAMWALPTIPPFFFSHDGPGACDFGGRGHLGFKDTILCHSHSGRRISCQSLGHDCAFMSVRLRYNLTQLRRDGQ